MAGPTKGTDTDTAAEPESAEPAAAPEPTSTVGDEKKGTPRCPTCHDELIKHGDENPFKVGAWHCNGCGACWASGFKRMRDGHPASAPI